jgi:hypothetical protein
MLAMPVSYANLYPAAAADILVGSRRCTASHAPRMGQWDAQLQVLAFFSWLEYSSELLASG